MDESYFNRLMNKIARDRKDVELYKALPDLAAEERDEHKALQKAIQTTMRQRIKFAEKEMYDEAQELNRVLYTLYKQDALYSLDSFMIAMEWHRDPKARFWLPRRKILRNHCEALQDLSDRRIQELFLSQPPRTGKTTLVLFFVLREMGINHGDTANLYCSYSATLTNAFYKGALEMLTDPEYNFIDIFPDCPVVQTNASDTTIDLRRKKRYASLTARSIQGTLNGATDASGGCVVADDLISGIEEALNPQRLEKAWTTVDNDLIPRGKENTTYLWIGTRWSTNDPIGKRMKLLKENPKYKDRRWRDITIPALDPEGNSNFEYENGVGFSTEYYERRRASFEAEHDEASWYAQYMNDPVEREGRLFCSPEMRFYDGMLPAGKTPVTTFMAVDPAFGGGDRVAAPICCQYENDDIYIKDVVFDGRTSEYTIPALADAIKRHHVQSVRVEANKNIEPFADDLEDQLKRIGYPLLVERKPASTLESKYARIMNKSGEIKKYFIFKDSNHRDKTYEDFMQEVYQFSILQNKRHVHDDAPDSLAMAADMIFHYNAIQTKVSQRLF